MFRLVGSLPAARVASTRMDRAGALPDSLELSWCVCVCMCVCQGGCACMHLRVCVCACV